MQLKNSFATVKDLLFDSKTTESFLVVGGKFLD